MNVLYLFFLSFVFSSIGIRYYVSGFVSGFVSHLPQARSQTRSQIRSKTCFADDDDHSKSHQNILPIELKQDFRVGMRNIVKTPLYIVIWKDCDDCIELLYNMELLDVKYFYFNVEERVGLSDELETTDFHGEDAEDQRRIVERRNSEKKVWKNLKDIQTQIPIFYKNDVFLGNQLMDIYSELYPI